VSQVSFTPLVPKSPENVNNLNAILAAFQAAINSVDSSQIAGGFNILTTPSGPGRSLKPFTTTVAVTSGGWQTVTVAYGFTMTSVLTVVLNPVPDTNGAALLAWSITNITASSVDLNVNSSLSQNLDIHGMVLGT
jgi:hypothetical protein